MLRQFSLKTYIFVWVFLAVAIPLIGLLLGTTSYSRTLYREEVRREIAVGLDNAVASVNRRLFVEQDLIGGLSRVAAVQAFLPALRALRHGQPHPDHAELTERVTQFFENFQAIRRSLGTVRIIDAEGDTLVKVRDGRRVPATIERLDTVFVVENGSEFPGFRDELDSLREGDVGSLPSPPGFAAQDAVFNTVLPLEHELEVVGYLAIAPPLNPLDRTLDVALRPFEARLLVAEVNSLDTDRHGRVLYDDRTGIRFSNPAARAQLQDRQPELLPLAFHEIEGQLTQAAGPGHVYFLQFNPYPDRLTSWLYAFEVDLEQLGTPFRHTPQIILIGILLALAIAALLARLGVRQIASPVSRLAQRLIGFADGQRGERLQVAGPRELKGASLAFNRMAATLDQAEQERDQAMQAMVQNAKLASVGQLAAGISHEISNPLANIYSLTKLVQRRLPPDDQVLARDVDNIRDEAERASRIISGLLNFSRQVPANPTVFEVGAWLRDGIALVQHAAAARQIRVDQDGVANCWVRGDRDLLQQTLINLLLNAIHASPDDGRVEVSASRAGDWLKVSVRDAGSGIDAATMNKIFDPFFTTKPEGEGTGLGLSICLGIVEHHGGKLTVANRDGGGAVASFTLPLEPAAAMLDTPPSEVSV